MCVQTGGSWGELVSLPLQLLELRSLAHVPPSAFRASTVASHFSGHIAFLCCIKLNYGFV